MVQLQSPLLRQYLEHWQSLCHMNGGVISAIPSSEDYLDRIEPKIAPFLMIFDVLPDDMIVRYQGEGIGERRRLEQTGQSWFALNLHLNARNVVQNVWGAIKTPCGVWTEATFVTNASRSMRVEALSLPVATQSGRPPRILNTSVALDSVDYDERAMGWQSGIKIGWLDLGFGVPATAAMPVG